MAPKRIFVLSGLLLLLVATVCLVRSGRLRRTTEKLLADLDAERLSILGEIQRAEKQVALAEKERDELQVALAGLRTGKAVIPGTAEPTRIQKIVEMLVPGRTSYEENELVREDPKLQVLEFQGMRARLGVVYGSFWRQLGLSAVQIETFKNLVAKRDEMDREWATVSEAKRMVGDPAIQAMAQSNAGEYRTGQIALLGYEGFRHLDEFERLRTARGSVDNLAGTAALAGIPLSKEQARHLTQALANANKSYRNGGGSNPWTIEWVVADAEAERILSGPQLALYMAAAASSGGWSRSEIQFEQAFLHAVNNPASNLTSEKSVLIGKGTQP